MLLNSLLGGYSAGPAPENDYWYGAGPGGISNSGRYVTPDSAMTVSAVYACISLLAKITAALPLIIYRRLPQGGKESAPGHPLYYLLHDQPNAWQTSWDFRAMLMVHLCLRGNAYAEIVPGPRGAVDQLIPLHPDRMTVEQLESGRLRYTVRNKDGTRRTLVQDEIFHIRNMSADGILGLSPIAHARETVGLTLAAEEHGARTFRNAARPSGALISKGKLSEDARKRLKAEWDSTYGGIHNVGKTPLFEGGELDWKQIGLSNQDAEYLASRKFQLEEIARWFSVPLFMIQNTEKTSSWGTGIEQMMIGFTQYTMNPLLEAWEQAITRDLIIAPGIYFAEFNLDGLMRGDSAARSQFYHNAVLDGWMTRNEVRAKENMNRLDGLDEPLTPANMNTPSKQEGVAP